MKPYRCPDPGHGEETVTLKANNANVYECAQLHKYWRREEGGAVWLVNLITQERYAAMEVVMEGTQSADRPRLNFMVDVPRLKGPLDFNTLSLSPAQWKVISRIDGKSNLEEIRLLAGMTPTQAEQVLFELEDAGLIEVRRSSGK